MDTGVRGKGRFHNQGVAGGKAGVFNGARGKVQPRKKDL
jgi:hypothetical protein